MDPKKIYEKVKKMNEYAHSMSDFIHAPGGLTKRNLDSALSYQKMFLSIISELKDVELTVPYHKKLYEEALSHYKYFSNSLVEK